VAQAWHFWERMLCPASTSNNILLLEHLNLQAAWTAVRKLCLCKHIGVLLPRCSQHA
jgi:hypothetical protein